VPTYEYRCKSCAHIFERFQPMTAKPLRRCPRCGKAVERLIGTGAGIIFKGSGFYATDYRSESYRQKAKSEAAPGVADSGAASKAKADGQGAAKADDHGAAKTDDHGAAKADPGKKAKGKD
jgi:putative FmdB family regulatory protein